MGARCTTGTAKKVTCQFSSLRVKTIKTILRETTTASCAESHSGKNRRQEKVRPLIFVGADMKNGSSTFQSESRKGRNEKRKETEDENGRQ